MSYVEHGPRIFLAGTNVHSPGGASTIYGDYVLPRKRSEGRLKVYDSCSDIRAWSRNSLENARYIRELTEHAATPGKIVPFNVVIDNVIGLGSQAQNDLTECRKELEKYKSLTLTPEQQQQLKILNESGEGRYVGRRSLTKHADKIDATTVSRSYSASPTRSGKLLASLDPDAETEVLGYAYDEEPNRSVSGKASYEVRGSADPPFLYAVNKTTSSHIGTPKATGVTSSGADRSVSSKATTATTRDARTPVSSTDEYSDEESRPGARGRTRKTGRKGGPDSSTTDKTTAFDSSSEGPVGTHAGTVTGTGTGTDTGTGTTSGSETETDDEAHRTIIIQKDSEIIALKNELGVKEAELDECREMCSNLEAALKDRDANLTLLRGDLKTSQDQMAGMGDQRNVEAERLKKKIGACECLIVDMKEGLNEMTGRCKAQAQEIEELRYRVQEAELLRIERDALARKVDEMGKLGRDAENCNLAMEKMKAALRERDELRRRSREQGCALADQEDEIKRLLALIDRLSAKYDNRQVKMKGALVGLRNEIEEKNSKICQCEEQLAFMEQEVGDLTVKLKNSLNSMDEFKIAYEDACNCADLDQDIYSQAKKALCKLNLTMGDLKEYKIERENLLQQIEDLRNEGQDNRGCCTCCQQNSSGSGPGPGPDSGPGGGAGSGNTGPYDRGTYDRPLLEMRKRKCSLQEELGELEQALRERMGDFGRLAGLNVVEGEANEEEDVVASAKQTIDRLNNAMLDLDSWECEKACMEDTIERLKLQISTLSGEGGSGEGIEGQIVEQASRSLIKLRHLVNELQIYQTERQEMRKQIQSLDEALADAQASATCQGTALLKQRLYEIRLENEKERKEHAEEITNLQKQLDEAENNSSCSGVKALRVKLREALRDAAYDPKVDEALATHVQKSIERISKIAVGIQGAGDDRTEIVREVMKQQEEINKLREQMVLEQSSKGDHADDDENRNKLLEEIQGKLELKTAAIGRMEEMLQSKEFENFGLNDELRTLKLQLRDLGREKDQCSEENEKRRTDLLSKEDRISLLERQLNSLQGTNLAMGHLEGKVEKMSLRLIALQEKNEKLQSELITLHGVLSERNEAIVTLVDEKEESTKEIANNATRYENTLQTKEYEIGRLEGINRSLEESLRQMNDKSLKLISTINELGKENEKLDQISELQKEIARLSKDKRKLEGEMVSFRSKLVHYENSNKKLEEDLNSVCGKNETLRYDITDLQKQNGKLSADLVFETEARENLTVLPDSLKKHITSLKERLEFTEMHGNDVVHNLENQISKLQIKSTEDTSMISDLQRQIKLQNDQACIQEEKILVIEKANIELKTDLACRLEEMKDLTFRVKKMGKDKFESKRKASRDKVTRKLSEELGSAKSRSDMMTENVAEVVCKINDLENENKQRHTEIQKLTCDIKAKNAEIKTLKEDVKSLSKERDDLITKLKNEMSQYKNSLMAVKQKYDRSVDALHEKHNESVLRLQTQHEEVMKDTGNPFDSETWLRSLSLNEIAELHNRICMVTSCVANEEESNLRSSMITIQQHQQDLSDKHQLNRRIATLENEIVQRQQDAQQKVYELKVVIAREQNRLQELSEAMALEQQRNSELQSRLLLFGENQVPSPTQRYPMDIGDAEKDILRRQSAYNQDRAQNIGILLEQQRKRVKELELVSMTGKPKDETCDWQRKNFIHQCSIHHKHDNY